MDGNSKVRSSIPKVSEKNRLKQKYRNRNKEEHQHIITDHIHKNISSEPDVIKQATLLLGHVCLLTITTNLQINANDALSSLFHVVFLRALVLVK